MTWIELTKGETGGVMIDGYTPKEGYLRGTALKIGKSEMLTRMENLNLNNLIQYGHPGKMSENSLFNLFDKLKFYITTRQQNPSTKDPILYWASCGEKIDKLGCLAFNYTSGSNFRSLENRIGRFLRGIGRKGALTVLKREYENNRQQAPGKHYLQNVVVFSREAGLYSGMGSERNWGWVDLLYFEIKKRETYVDYEAFRNIWLKILEQAIDHYVELSRYVPS